MRRISAISALLGCLFLTCTHAMAGNPISPRFNADPSPHYFNGRFYLYATNDQDNSGKYWDSTDWRVFSSDDLAHWKDDGSFLSVSVFQWARPDAKAWAPEAAYRKGKYYYYAPVGGDRIGVAVADAPEGPFRDARGDALIDKARDANAGDEPIDPAVLIDDDGQAYLTFGTRVPKIVRLAADMIHTEGPIQDLTITGFPADDAKKRYGEAPFLHKHNGLYYFSFSTGWPGQIVYATASQPMGPYAYRGVILDYLKISTNHQAVLEYGGKSYLFYHDNLLPGGGDYKRSIAIDALTYNADGTINPVTQTREGVGPVVTIPDNRAFILTPPPSPAPRINGPSVFGVRPGSPLLYHIPVTGDRPMTYSAKGLPAGVTLDAATGQLTGTIAKAGTYRIILIARNARGEGRRAFRLKVGAEIALTPPMGWNSYNVWSDQVDQDKMLAAARAMVSSGLIEHGWTYINMDDGWQGQRGGALNALQPNPDKFSDFTGMIAEIHTMGLKVGLYSSPWVQTYANRLGGSAENPEGTHQDWPANVPHNKKQLPYAVGRYRFLVQDAQQFADWGIDYLKYDWGPVEYPEAKDMYDALRAQPRDIVYSLSNNHERNMFADIGRISTVANAWRTTTDINDNWKRVADDIGFNQAEWAPFARPGHVNDADMLVIGVVGWGKDKQHYTKLTPDEQYSHVSLWALLSSPMLLGNDLTQLDPFTLSLLSNDDVIAVDQDALVRQAVPVKHDGTGDIYVKPLEDGAHAVGLFNRDAAPVEITINWNDIGLKGSHKVRDLWRQKDLGRFRTGFTTTVAPHGVALIKVR